MQALQRTFRNVQTHLAALPANAKILFAALLIIAVMAFLLVSQYSSKQDMLPLGLTSASTNVRADAVSYLEGAGVEYEDRGGDLYVPAEQRLSLLGRLNEQKIVSVDEINFNSLIDLQSNPFLSQAQSRQMWLTAKMNVLSAIIAARRDIASAQVIIDQPEGRSGIGSSHLPARAVATVQMRDEALTQESANAIGHTIAGAVAGLKLEDIVVTDTTSSFRPRPMEESGGGAYLEPKRRLEEHYRGMIEDFMQHIPGTVVTVNAVVRNTRETIKQTTLDEPIIAPSSAETRDFESTSNPQGGVAGVDANVGARINGGARNTQVTESSTSEEKDSFVGGTERLVQNDTGYPLQVNAIVGIPRSWFVKLYQEEQGGDTATEPDAAALATFVQDQVQKFQNDLAPLIKTDPLEDAVPGEIIVRMIHDFDTALAASAGGAAIVGSGGFLEAAGGAGSLLKNAGLGALALISLVMMLLMVKKANARAAAQPGAGFAGATVQLAPAPARNFDGGRPGGSTQDFLGQINQLVNAGPDDAAGVLDRWIATGARS